MTKTKRTAASNADETFQRHYATIWGEERWNNSLYPALLRPTRYACVLNRYTPLDHSAQVLKDDTCHTKALTLPQFSSHSVSSTVELSQICFVRCQIIDTLQDPPIKIPSTVVFPTPALAANKLFTHWNLDAASILVANALNVAPGDNVLDLCAAPGGKSIVLAQRIWPHYHHDPSESKQKVLENESLRGGQLHANEYDGLRQKRLADNLASYLPEALFHSKQIQTLRVDGSRAKAAYELKVKKATGTVGYDKVLVDAPCSSERHIIHASLKAAAAGRIANEMANWRPGSSKRLATTQIDLLMTGIKAARPGGTIVYATCSIEPTENDNVVNRVLIQVEKDRKKGLAEWRVAVGFNGGSGDEALEREIEKTWAERTTHGWIVLPDHPSGEGWGPLYFAVLTKVAG